jgi:hypothetical protein
MTMQRATETGARPRVTRRLDLRNPREIEAYERAFYRGFERATHNRLVRWLWEWDDAERRLRCRVPYPEQQIWVIDEDATGIGSAIAVNLGMQTLQAAAYGFAVPADLVEAARGGRVCEFLTFFAVGDHSLAAKHALWTELFDDLRADGFIAALATTAPKVLPLYRRMGVTVLAEAALEGETRYFLRFDLSRTAARVR